MRLSNDNDHVNKCFTDSPELKHICIHPIVTIHLCNHIPTPLLSHHEPTSPVPFSSVSPAEAADAVTAVWRLPSAGTASAASNHSSTGDPACDSAVLSVVRHLTPNQSRR